MLTTHAGNARVEDKDFRGSVHVRGAAPKPLSVHVLRARHYATRP